MKNNLSLLIGDNEELINFYLQNILDKINYQIDNKIGYDLTTNTITDILDEASMMSLFAQNKVIIGTNLNISDISEEGLEYLTKYLDNPNPNSYIILLTSKVDSRTKIYKLFKDKFNIIDTTKINYAEDILKYITNYIKEKKYLISSQDLEYFLSKTGNNLDNINLELAKLFAYKDKEKTITKEDIDLLIQDNIDNIIYEFTNAIYENNYSKIIKMYEDFTKENLGFDYLLTSLDNSFRQSLIIKLLYKEGKSNYEIASIIGKKEFYVKKMQERLYNYSIKDLANYLNKLSIIDINYKSGKITTDMLKLFLINKDPSS